MGELTESGLEQAQRIVGVLKDAQIDAIFCSPFVRALQTAAPLAASLGKAVRIDNGLCELLAKGWLYDENPLPALKSAKIGITINEDLIDRSYTSPMPEWPDHEGVAWPGNVQQRAKCVARHR